jgi:hypothetical protein
MRSTVVRGALVRGTPVRGARVRSVFGRRALGRNRSRMGISRIVACKMGIVSRKGHTVGGIIFTNFVLSKAVFDIVNRGILMLVGNGLLYIRGGGTIGGIVGQSDNQESNEADEDLKNILILILDCLEDARPEAPVDKSTYLHVVV